MGRTKLLNRGSFYISGAEIENYGGQPNQQCADYLTVHDSDRMIWSGYTGAAGWMLRQACESVVVATLADNQVVFPHDLNVPRNGLTIKRLRRNLAKSRSKLTSNDCKD